ncbi:ABC transporter permease [bacterium]|nr:ABC transporter permease [bacterium]
MKALRRGQLSLYIGATIVISMISIALLTPFLPLVDPQAQDLVNQYAVPSFDNIFGRGENGVDLLSQVFWGTRLSLGVGIGSVLFASLIGMFLGSWAGYKGGIYDLVLMRIVDLLYAFPGILLVVALAAVLGPSVKNMMIVMVATSWAGYARLVRGVTLSLREREYVAAAHAQGASTMRVLSRHLWPNLLAPLMVQMTFGLGGAIMVESSLSFLGLGAPPGTPSWGQLLNQGREVLTLAPHVVIVPGMALVLTILGLNLMGDGLRDRLDPKVR